jgi:hypothetical protein
MGLIFPLMKWILAVTAGHLPSVIAAWRSAFLHTSKPFLAVSVRATPYRRLHSSLTLSFSALNVVSSTSVSRFDPFAFRLLWKRSARSVSLNVNALRVSHSNPVLDFRGFKIGRFGRVIHFGRFVFQPVLKNWTLPSRFVI